NIKTGTEVMLQGEHLPFMCSAFLGQTHLLVGHTSGELWDGDTGTPVAQLSGLQEHATAMTSRCNNDILVLGGVNGNIYLYAADTRKLLRFFRAFDEASVSAVALSSDGKMLAAGCHDVGLNDRPGHAEIKIWKLSGD